MTLSLFLLQQSVHLCISKYENETHDGVGPVIVSLVPLVFSPRWPQSLDSSLGLVRVGPAGSFCLSGSKGARVWGWGALGVLNPQRIQSWVD